jgi:dienelactone hydrolase
MISTAHFARPDIAPEPARIVALSEGAALALAGDWPARTVDAAPRSELHLYAAPVATRKGRAIVIGGGGYVRYMYDREGVEVALWLNGLGLDAYVLVHRFPGAPSPDGVWPKDVAAEDAQLALDFLNTENGDEAPVIVGLSSGGHLAGVMACLEHPLKRAGVIIAYAPINANHRQYKFPPDKPDYPPLEKQDFYDDWPIGLSSEAHGVPKIPVFLAYALTDQIVPVEHALRFVRTAAEQGIDLDAHIFGQAPHGFALDNLHGTHAAWPQLAADWIARKLG